jgi:hypothetical protein
MATGRATYSRHAIVLAQKVLKITYYVVAGEGTVRIAGRYGTR